METRSEVKPFCMDSLGFVPVRLSSSILNRVFPCGVNGGGRRFVTFVTKLESSGLTGKVWRPSPAVLGGVRSA